MFETVLINSVWSGFLLGLPIAVVIGIAGKYLDHMGNYGNYLWKVRYWIAHRYAKGDPRLEKILVDLYLQAANVDKLGNYNGKMYHPDDNIHEEAPKILHEAYKAIGHKDWRFNRWICSVCISGFISLIISLITVPFVFYFHGFITGIMFFFTVLVIPYKFSK